MPRFQKVCGCGKKDKNNRDINLVDYIYIGLFFLIGFELFRKNYVIQRNHKDSLRMV